MPTLTVTENNIGRISKSKSEYIFRLYSKSKTLTWFFSKKRIYSHLRTNPFTKEGIFLEAYLHHLSYGSQCYKMPVISTICHCKHNAQGSSQISLKSGPHGMISKTLNLCKFKFLVDFGFSNFD